MFGFFLSATLNDLIYVWLVGDLSHMIASFSIIQYGKGNISFSKGVKEIQQNGEYYEACGGGR